MTDEKKINLRFLINNKTIIFTNAILISETEKFITFKDIQDNKTKTYSKDYLINSEVFWNGKKWLLWRN